MKLVIIDASCYFYRSFFGSPEGPVAGLVERIQSALRSLNPNQTVMALDAGRENFRNQLYPFYKSNRPPSPDGYSHTVPAMTAALIQIGVRPYSVPGFEADDVIGSLCARYDKGECIILSRDKDLTQLVVGKRINLWYDEKRTDEDAVIEKFGVPPKRIVEVMGLAGDGADGIPGVPGIGMKTAISLVQYFQDLENLFDNLADVEQILERGAARIRKQLEQSKDVAFLSRRLATIRTDVPLPGDTND